MARDGSTRREVTLEKEVPLVEGCATEFSRTTGGLPNLLLHPGQCRVGRDVCVDDPSRPDLHHDEDVNDGEEGRELDQEVAGTKLLCMVADEGAPSLISSRRPLPGDHVAADGAGGVVDAELRRKLFGNPVLAPLGMVAGDAPDEGDVLGRNVGSPDRPPGFAAPEDPEALSVPTDHGLRLDDDERAGPVRP